jgi:uncharacterized protein (UPF0212 family)
MLKNKALWVDEKLHHTIKVMAVSEKLSVDQYIRKLVENKLEHGNIIIKPGSCPKCGRGVE